MLLLLLAIEVAVNGGERASWGEWAAVAVCTVLTCVLEAFTTQIDNLFLPLFYSASLLAAAALDVNRE